MYPVEVAYLSEPSSDYVESAVQAVFDIHAKVSLACPGTSFKSTAILIFSDPT